MKKRSQQRGFTLIEMMIALVLFAAVTVGMMSVAVTMTNGYRDQEVTIATEGATRAALEFMSQGLRGASPGVSNPNSVTEITNCGVAVGNSFRVEQNTTVTGLTSRPDAFTVVMPVGQVMTTTAAAVTTASTTVDVRNGNDFSINDQIMITNHDVGHVMKVTGKSGNTLSVATFNCSGAMPTGGYPAGSPVIRVVRARFSIGFISAADTVPMLFMDPDDTGALPPEPIAEGIEDMQVAIGIDGDANGVINQENTPSAAADEWLGNNLSDVAYTNQAGVRAVRITLVARTAKEASGINAYRLPAIEDRVQNPTTDNFRRRILSSVIEVRNLGGSP